jgi:hypothetical protein
MDPLNTITLCPVVFPMTFQMSDNEVRLGIEMQSWRLYRP